MSRKIVGVTVGTPISPQAIVEKAEFDNELSQSSENAVQNKIITAAMNKKADLDESGKLKLEQIPEDIKVKTDNTLKFSETGVLGVNTAQEVEKDNTLPITAAAVHTTVGNIEVLLGTI